MKILYIECNMGAAGDMLMAALLELHPDPDDFIRRMNGLGIPGVTLSRERAVKCGICGTRVVVAVDGAEEESRDVAPGQAVDDVVHTDGGHGTGLADVEAIIGALPLPDGVKADAQAVYRLLAEAESAVHGRPVDTLHFHEVGAMDAVADIVGTCLLMDALAPQRVVVSPVQVGSGQVRCAHGILPVPAPATAHILRGVPSCGGAIRAELCTPTGAALLRHFAGAFGPQPLMVTEAVGIGMGKKDFPVANCLRVFVGEGEGQEEADEVVEVVCNLDDMTGEELGFALETLLENGALDVFLAPVQMKKNRPGQLLVCLCRPQDEEKMAALVLRHTTSFGVRSSRMRRHTLARAVETVETEAGPLRVKRGQGFGTGKSKVEYEDLAQLARRRGISLFEARELLGKRR